MNKRNLHKILADRFEREAASGYNSVPGSEDYFNGLENPFIPQRPQAQTKGNLRILLLEIGLMSGLLLFLKFGWTSTEKTLSLPLKNEMAVQEKNTAIPQPVPVPETPKTFPVAIVSPQHLPRHLQQKSFVRNAVKDTATLVFTPIVINNPPNVAIDSVAPEVKPKLYHYSDYRQFYKLRYLSDMLVIDYGDSVSQLKLEPILGGSPANIEGSLNNKPLREKPPVYQTIKQNLYLEELEKGMKSLRAGEWNKALIVFNGLFAKNVQDQNAIFYGALCLYEKGKYQESIDRLGELQEISQPVFEQDADYYLALAFMKNGDHAKAREQLKRMAASDSFYRDKAANLLKELR